ncbi:GH16330 [Drosophila grimshawi]|uniref:GH16330 n=2 Tax=Drosophila grimshawi TaxID=7222 RepID=B4IYP0_DROGR|nr:GH16330 [Drosophila grimshawi]
MTLWLNEGNNNNNSSTNKYIAPSASSAHPKMCASSITNEVATEFNEICKKAQDGQKIMIIMRGAPGSGKTTLAKTLLQQIRVLDEHYSIGDFVHSSDDFFVTCRGYEFNPTQLSDAHEWNKQRVLCKAATGWSPIIVDNTNIMVWEMQPYVQIAVQHGYVLELLEPKTSWCKSPGKLAQRNVHRVPKENIERMLDRYEKTSVVELLKLLKETKYTVPIPQLRSIPPLPQLAAPSKPSLQPEVSNADSNGIKLNINAQTWVPYEKNANSYWAQQQQPQGVLPMQTNVVAGVAATSENSLLDLLRDEPTISTVAPVSSTDDDIKVLQRHCLNCPNEATGFVLLRQMYPNKQLAGLWDLFVKCNGDVDWAVDILIKEDELTADGSDYAEDALLLESDEFQCDCNNKSQKLIVQLQTQPPPVALSLKTQAKPQRQPRARRNASGQGAANSSANKELQLQIENRFVLADDQYSEHTRKVRDIRNGILDQPLAPVEPAPLMPCTGADEDDEDSEDNALLEMDLDDNLIAQLRSHFQWEGEMLPTEPESLPTKVFVPRSLAKQLYMVWMEAVHNQLEEQRQQTLRDDEQFARLLKHPKYAECSESPGNVNELLDMELAWSIYNSEQQAANQATRHKPNDIATHLTKMKLCEKFPEIPNDTVLQVFSDTENNYVKTVEVLDSNVQSDLTGPELYEQALRENRKLNEQEQQTPSKSLSPRPTVNAKSPQLHEEAKCAALRDFEETRNLAAHHAQLRAECNLKAKQAIQHGNGSVALYYSEIAQLHKKKIDVFNHRAANCIMEVHKHTQNNPDLLDLHYLHTMEAISSLDLFLDRHITVLRNCTRVYKHVFIITGRGLHSANGVSTIKKNVKARLGERRLRWQEVNPGLLRVKIFSASRHSKNF